uniref:Uncharacterized protein n=1 Tax=Octopus bimaculoides TaxID=37653 RepID=A0A0L8H4B8_OCTBM
MKMLYLKLFVLFLVFIFLFFFYLSILIEVYFQCNVSGTYLNFEDHIRISAFYYKKTWSNLLFITFI